MKKKRKNKDNKDKIIVEKVSWQYKMIEYLSYLIIFLIPLYVNPNLVYPFNTSKITILILLVSLQAIFYFWSLFKQKEFKFKINYLHIILFIFFSILTLSSLLGVDKINSFFGWKDYVSLVPLYFLGLFSLFLGFLIKKDKKILTRVFTISLIASVLVMLLYYFLNADNPFYRQGSTLGNNSYLGTYLMFNIAFGFGLFFYFKKGWQKILIAMLTLFIALCPLFINTGIFLGKVNLKEAIANPMLFSGIAHGAILGLILTILFSISLSLIILSRKKVFRMIGLALFIIFSTSILYIGFQLRNDESKIYQIYVTEKSDNRFLAWDIAKEGFKDKPILGNGFNNYIYNFQTYYNPKIYREENSVEKFTYPHNVFWQYASDGGILGLSIYLILLLGLLFVFYIKDEDREITKIKIILGSLLIGYFVSNLFIFDTIVTYLMFFLLIGLALGLCKEEKGTFIFSISNPSFHKSLSILGIIISFSAIIFLFYLPTKEAGYFNKLTKKTNNVVVVAEEIIKMHEISFFGGIEDNAYHAKELYSSFQKHSDEVNSENLKYFQEAITSTVQTVEDGLGKQPNLNEAYLTMSRLLNLQIFTQIIHNTKKEKELDVYEKELWDKSHNYLEQSLKLSPNNIQPYILLSELYLFKGDYLNSINYIKQAIILAPENPLVYKKARVILGLKENQEFEKYLDEMENKYLKP